MNSRSRLWIVESDLNRQDMFGIARLKSIRTVAERTSGMVEQLSSKSPAEL